MENKNYVVVEDEEKYDYDNVQEIIKSILGENYYELPKEERYQKMKLKTFINAKINNLPIFELTNKNDVDINLDGYILFNEMTFLLSLAKNKDIVIFEKEGNTFTKELDTSNLRRINEKYIVINDIANALLEKEINSCK